MISRLRRLGVFAAALAFLAGTASAYYYFTSFPGGSSSSPVPEKFDLNAIPNKTVSLFISDLGPAQLAPGDSYPAIVSQIRLAAKAWNDVETSGLRIAFGGLFSQGTPQNTPHIEMTFDDVPGVLGECGPMSAMTPLSGPAGQFVPILRSTCIVNRDLTQRPSFGEAFFLTAVHELGHALGLQHTMTSSAMSTEPTRGTTRAFPLANDDVAGISALYPNARFFSQTGSIAGRVTLSGRGVHLASVVALTPDKTAFSALTNPDGTYRIDGISPGQYFVYAQPLPPEGANDGFGPGGVVLPLGQDQAPIPAGDPFDTQFYPGTRNVQQAQTVGVASGSVTGGIDFAVQSRTSLQLLSVTTYSFPGQVVAVKPAFLSTGEGTRTLDAISIGAGLTSNGAPARGLNVSVLGGAASVQQMRANPQASQYLEMDLGLDWAAPGPRHMVFSLNNEIYVLPSAFYVVNNLPPSISAVTPGVDSTGSRAAFITGTNLLPDTRILFDGLPAARSSDVIADGTVVYPPPGAGAYQATVTALNSDGQSSLFLQGQTPATYTYDSSDSPSIALSLSTLPAGAEAMVEITGVNTNFVDGQTRVGFGSSDILVRRVWVMSPARLRAEIWVAPGAAQVASLVSVVTGFQVISQPFAFQVAPFSLSLPVVNPQLLNPATGQPGGAYPGATVVLQASNLPNFAGSVRVLLNDQPAPVLGLAPGQVLFVVPPNMQAGPAVLRLQSGAGDLAYPVIVTIDAPLPVVSSVVVSDPVKGIRPGDFVTLMAMNLAEPGAQIAANRVHVAVANIDHTALFVAPSGVQHQVLFSISTSVPSGMQPLTVSIDGRTSAPFLVPIRSM